MAMLNGFGGDADALWDLQTPYQDMKTGGNREWAFPRVWANAFTDGSYRGRLIPSHPTHCPNGMLRIITHKVQGQSASDVQMVLHESQVTKAEERSPFITALLNVITESGKLKEMSPELQKFVSDLVPEIAFQFPMIFWCEHSQIEYTKGNGETGKKTQLSPATSASTKPFGVVLELTQKTLVKRIQEVVTLVPNINNHVNGHDVRLSKSGSTYSFDPIPTPSPLDEEGQATYAGNNYPNMVANMGRLIRKPVEIRTRIQKSWAAAYLLGYGIDVTGDMPRLIPTAGQAVASDIAAQIGGAAPGGGLELP